MRTFTLSIVSLLLAGCAATEPDPRGVARDETLLSVSAIGRTETRPDEARFSVGVQSIGASAGAATTANNQAMARVVAAIEATGVGKDDLQTRALTVQRIDYGRDRGRFSADNVVEARIRNIGRVGAAIAAATEAGANVLSGPDLRVSDRERANLSAYAEAYKAARARAEAYAGAAGLEIARVLAISDGGEYGGPPMPYARNAMAETAPSPVSAPPIRAGTNTSEVSVRVDFALKRP